MYVYTQMSSAVKYFSDYDLHEPSVIELNLFWSLHQFSENLKGNCSYVSYVCTLWWAFTLWQFLERILDLLIYIYFYYYYFLLGLSKVYNPINKITKKNKNNEQTKNW